MSENKLLDKIMLAFIETMQTEKVTVKNPNVTTTYNSMFFKEVVNEAKKEWTQIDVDFSNLCKTKAGYELTDDFFVEQLSIRFSKRTDWFKKWFLGEEKK